jgi:hypothetical protein
MTALMKASKNANLTAVETLLNHGEPEGVNDKNKVRLMIRKPREECIKSSIRLLAVRLECLNDGFRSWE